MESGQQPFPNLLAASARFRALAWFSLLFLGSCSRLSFGDGEADANGRALFELERLVFVPAAPCRLYDFRVPNGDQSLDAAILVDRFEVSRRDWLYYYPEVDDRPLRWDASIDGFGEERLDWPAVVSFDEARELAELRGMRLLTSREWIHAAVGRSGNKLPWGSKEKVSVANTLELGLGTPTRVGTFENGLSEPFGLADMMGNVWEWVSDRVPAYADEPDIFRESDLEGPLEDRWVSILGGGYNSIAEETFRLETWRDPRGERLLVVFNARTVDRGFTSPEVGVRLGADAEIYLLAQAPKWPRASNAKARVREVGRRWAEDSGREFVEPLLQELASRQGAPTALQWLADGASLRTDS